MAKEKIDLIANVIRASNQPLSISEIRQQTGGLVGDRTLQRRLEKLVSQNEIKRLGRGRATTYTSISEAEPVDHNSNAEIIPLIAESKKLLTLVSRPLTSRIPVGYNRNFLDAYQPNITNYLSREEKKRLSHFGKTARENEPAGTYAKDILQRLLIDLSWNSSRLEGNTYSLLDTQLLLANGEAANNKSAKETQMILNHKDAIEFIVVNSGEVGFNRYTLLNIHALLSNNLLPDPSASGRLRTHGVGIQQSVYTPPGIPQVIEEMFTIILEKVGRIKDPFEQAFFMMVHLPYLQPFDDVNKRVSRIAANISLNGKNLVPVSFVDVPQSLYIKGQLAVYELNKIELLKDVFLWAYERSSGRYSALRQSLGEPDPFRLKYRDQIRLLIYEIVSAGIAPRETSGLIDSTLPEIQAVDRNRFKEAVETELMSLHEGNMARYAIRPSQFYQLEKCLEAANLRKPLCDIPEQRNALFWRRAPVLCIVLTYFRFLGYSQKSNRPAQLVPDHKSGGQEPCARGGHFFVLRCQRFVYIFA